MKIDRLSTLKVFVSAVDAGSISGAAHRHGLSTTSASRRLMELEQELGVRLLDRTTRYVAPTEAGRRLRDRVAPLVAGVELALREAGEDPHLPSARCGSWRGARLRCCTLRRCCLDFSRRIRMSPSTCS